MLRRTAIFGSIVLLAASSFGKTRTAIVKPPTSGPATARIVLLHHSTGECVWNGGVAACFDAYNGAHGTHYSIVEQAFPKESPYGWNNYPFDYWNIWVRHAGDKPYQEEPTLEILSKQFDVIVFKHCFPVSAIEADVGSADVADDSKRIENYKLQYEALRAKMRSFPKTRFIVWTGAALLKSETDEASARRAQTFFEWVKNTWDTPGDNIYVWDFRQLETDGGLYLKPQYGAGDSHPNEAFSKRVAPRLCARIVDVIAGRGDASPLTGGQLELAGGKNGVSPAEPPMPSGRRTTSRGATPVRSAGGPDRWIFDDGEAPGRLSERWSGGVVYAPDGKQHALAIEFSKGAEEEWGEYGKQRVIASKRPAKNEDVSAFDVLSFRVRSDRQMELVVMLRTRPDALPRDDASYFDFSGYVQIEPGAWQSVVLDLSAMELGMEGDKAYKMAGQPARPMRLSEIRLVTNEKNERANIAIDDIAFSRGRRTP